MWKDLVRSSQGMMGRCLEVIDCQKWNQGILSCAAQTASGFRRVTSAEWLILVSIDSSLQSAGTLGKEVKIEISPLSG